MSQWLSEPFHHDAAEGLPTISTMTQADLDTAIMATSVPRPQGQASHTTHWHSHAATAACSSPSHGHGLSQSLTELPILQSQAFESNDSLPTAFASQAGSGWPLAATGMVKPYQVHDYLAYNFNMDATSSSFAEWNFGSDDGFETAQAATGSASDLPLVVNDSWNSGSMSESGWNFQLEPGSSYDTEIVQPGLEVQVSILGSQTLVAGELQNLQPDMEPEQVQSQAIILFVTPSLYNAEAYHWVNVFKDACRILQIHLYETTNINISDGLAKEILAKVVFDYKCTAHAYGMEWKPENTLPNGHTVLTDLSNTAFNNYIIKELKGISSRFTEHLWPQALKLVTGNTSSQTYFSGPPVALIPVDLSINRNQLDEWTNHTDGHGYGNFHQITQHASDCPTLEPFRNVLFQQTFWKAASAADNHSFNLVNKSALTLFLLKLIAAVIETTIPHYTSIGGLLELGKREQE
ncbi:hypothetical protein L210DRAFT_3630381 [Boletus edulis BED1]|uniref:Uncharacterized protein n=1 Tax=Boletus edulis BED1 TaxID=1328754 RepID=A0AAD4BVM7_BOLED|nr:hypothetical protein L210DRAFT_3630381 [Boletus edulis BED1]